MVEMMVSTQIHGWSSGGQQGCGGREKWGDWGWAGQALSEDSVLEGRLPAVLMAI